MATEVYVNNGQTTVATAYSAGGTTLVVADGSMLPSLEVGEVAHVVVYNQSNPANAEIMRVTARSGNTLTVVPAVEAIAGSQTEFDHGIGDVVANNITVEALNNIATQIAGALILQAILDHEAESDPHPQYLTSTEGDAAYAALSHTHSFASLTSKPTTLSGYGITDAQGLDATLTALAGLTIAANSLTIGTGADAFSQTTFAANTFPARASTGNLEAKTITDLSLVFLNNSTSTQMRATLELGTSATLDVDTDGTFAANSNERVPSQRAVKTYVDNVVSGVLEYKGTIDCSTNPNYPSGSKGDTYLIDTAGKIGGASGRDVDAGDMVVATADNGGGDEATVGYPIWVIIEHNLVGALLSANNLSDLADAAQARENLGLEIGVDVQAYDADLTTWAGLTPSANAQSLVTAADYAAMRGLLDLEAGTDFYSISGADAAFQPKDATLTALAGQNWAANAIPIGTGSDTLAQTSFAANTFPARASTGNLEAKTISDFALTILDDADAAAVRTTIGAGTGNGSVTSVAMTVPSILSVSGSPVTTSGTLAVSLATQNANIVFAGPTSGGAATPTFRSLVVADLPSLTGFSSATIADADEIAFADADASNANKKTTALLLSKYILPPGAVIEFAGSSIPSGFLNCNGSAVSRTTYADLFSAIGTTFGVGDGSTTFNLPDIRSRAVIGVGQGSGLTNRTLGSTVGAETHQLTSSEMPSHTHGIGSGGSFIFSTGAGSNNFIATGGVTTSSATATNATGSDGSHNNMQPSIALYYIIKY